MLCSGHFEQPALKQQQQKIHLITGLENRVLKLLVTAVRRNALGFCCPKDRSQEREKKLAIFSSKSDGMVRKKLQEDLGFRHDPRGYHKHHFLTIHNIVVV